MYVCVARFHV
jgi:hypothetical protein